MKAKVFFVCLLFAVFFLTSASYSQVPQMINYQGKVTTATGGLVNGNYNMTFSIYDDTIAGNLFWTETQLNVHVENGIFSVYLGSVNPIPDTVFTGDVRYLGVKVGSDPEIIPRKAMVSVPYAFRAETGGGWTVVGDTIYCLQGNVGIGTKHPRGLLQVGEPVIITDDEDVGISHSADPEYTPDAKLEIVREPNKDLLMLSSTQNADGDLFIVNEDGNVGIGTNNPQHQLDVWGELWVRGPVSACGLSLKSLSADRAEIYAGMAMGVGQSLHLYAVEVVYLVVAETFIWMAVVALLRVI